MLDYKLLEALGCVIHEKGFDKAAQKLFITQSAVSQRIKALEEQAGQILVTRTAPPCATPEGQRLLKHYMQVRALEMDLGVKAETKGEMDFNSFSIGINADSLATWFFPAVDQFLKQNKILIDLKIGDQGQTHKMLRSGDVSGCISSESKAVQGCRVTYIGTMNYRLAATPEFVQTWSLKNLDKKKVQAAPAVIFNRQDDLHELFFKRHYHEPMPVLPVHYVPSSERFASMIINGLAYGMIPDLQGLGYIDSGNLLDLAPDSHIRVDLYWHRWNLSSIWLDDFSQAIVKNARIC